MGQRARAALILALAGCAEPPPPTAPTPLPPTATATVSPRDTAPAPAAAASAPSIACGTVACVSTKEFCDSSSKAVGDGGASATAACKPLPAACASNRTCACLKTAGVTGTICDDTGGQIVNSSVETR
jgi:hypothetical protein